MHKEDLLDNYVKNEYLLLKLLYLSSRELKKSEICERLNITLPTLGKIVESLQVKLLNDDISSNQLELIVTRNSLELKFINDVSIDMLAEVFLKDSNKYKVFRYLFSRKKISYVKLENYLQVSTTTLGRIIGSCNELLTDYNLKISHGRIVGDIKQQIFFYYSFFWVSSVDEKKSNSNLLSNLVEEVSVKYNLSVVQREQFYLWSLVTLKKIGEVSMNSLSIGEQKDVEQYSKTPINKFFQKIYIKHKSIYNESEVQLFSYFLSLFFISFGMTSYEIIQLGLFNKRNPAFELTSKIMAAIKAIFILDKQDVTIETNVFSLLSQIYYFRGNSYSTDSLTFMDYFKLFNSSFSTRFVSDVIKEIVEPSSLFDSFKLDQIEKRLIFLLYTLSPKKKYCVKIGVVLTTSHLVLNATILLLETELNNRRNITITQYVNDENFDLVISNISNSLLENNYKYFYQLTNIGPYLDIERLDLLIDKIALEKYQSFTFF